MEQVADADHYLQLFERLPGAAFILKRQGGAFLIVAHNKAGETFGDHAVASLIGRPADALEPYDPSFTKYLERAAATGETLEKEDFVRFQSGLVRRIHAAFVPLSPDIVVVHGRDVTVEREREARFHQSEALLRVLFAVHPDSIMRMDANARILEVHYPAAMDPRPFEPEQLIGHTVGDFFGPQAQETQVFYNKEAIRTGQMQCFEVRFPDGDRLVHLEARVGRISDDEVLVISRDVSDRAEHEDNEIIREREEKGRLSREIQDGLAQILVGADLQIDNVRRCLEQEGSPHAVTLRNACDLILQAVGQARDLSSGVSPIPHGTALFEALRTAAHHAERRLKVRCSFRGKGADSIVGQVATTHLYRIVEEAIAHAVRHRSATVIEIDCTIDHEKLVLSVRDDGAGLAHASDTDAGIGLKNMRYRARSIGGEIKLCELSSGACTELRFACSIAAFSDRQR